MKSTREFLERLVNDKEFAKKFESIKDLEDLKKVAGGEGYDINLEEYKKIQKEASQLSDEDLEKTAGGYSIGQFNRDFNEGIAASLNVLNGAGQLFAAGAGTVFQIMQMFGGTGNKGEK